MRNGKKEVVKQDIFMKQAKEYVGSNFDDFLRSEGILEEVETIAMQRVGEFIQSEEFSLPISPSH